MSKQQLNTQLEAFARWKDRQRKTLCQLEPWLKQQSLYTPDAHSAIEQSLQALSGDQITVAVAGEFSRGKTELINALFFSEYGRRLLPTDAGRTTMCPTEIFQDSTIEPYLRLLPISTRNETTSLQALKEDEAAWEHHPLYLNNPAALEAQLNEITASHRVSIQEAEKMGLYHAKEGHQASTDHTVEVPKWRLAQINIRHPLLEKGLRILDTPGLNAVGNEPELTYEMLPSAQAILFVLGADTGVTRSDLEMWQQLIQKPGRKRRPSLMVILNKVDTLWDELRSEEKIESSIQRQAKDVAAILNVEESQIFAVSAQKALVAKIQTNKVLLERSNILSVESYLSSVMVENRRDLIIQEQTNNVCDALESLEGIVNTRLTRNNTQIKSLGTLSGQGDTALSLLLQETQNGKIHYQKSVDAYRESKAAFKTHGKTLVEALNLSSLEFSINKARNEMEKAWTTHGLKNGMMILFEDINSRMDTVSSQSQSMRRLVRGIYRRFQTQHDFYPMKVSMFSIVTHQVELGLLHQEAEVFRNSSRTTFTEQHFVVQRYFETIVNRANNIFRQAREDAIKWLNTALNALTIQIKEHRDAVSLQINDLKEAGQSEKTIKHRINGFKRENARFNEQLESLRNVANALQNNALPDENGQITPHLISQDITA